MSTDDSDIDSKTASLPPKKLPKENILPPKENVQHGKKLTTKLMIIDALTELKTRKGVSLYAIKTHLTEKFQVNTEKLNFMIKKTLKTCVEDGTFVQLKGVGASGSFKLATSKVTKPKKKKETENGVKEKKKEIPEKKQKKSLEKGPITKSKQKVKESKVENKDTNKVNKRQTSVEEMKKKPKMETMEGKEKKTKVKMAVTKEKDTTAKKRAAMVKRRSIGSIIKPPKMKPTKK